MTTAVWGRAERAHWYTQQVRTRSYRDDVLDKLAPLTSHFERLEYGALSIDPERYPLVALKSLGWREDLPVLLVTGGVHGYETSGVQGALDFAQIATRYTEHLNILICPCVSPWGYETINRWNPQAIDPNRSFIGEGQSEESRALIALYNSLEQDVVMHIDLHETTDTDNSVFRPALAARDGLALQQWHIPDGYYLVGDAERPVAAFQRAIIEAVAKVTHIAAPDAQGEIIGEPITQPGVINYRARALGLCAGMTKADYVTT
ncbi:MAG: M14 family metallopeptidase, partial [Pseudomonadales bacterium]